MSDDGSSAPLSGSILGPRFPDRHVAVRLKQPALHRRDSGPGLRRERQAGQARLGRGDRQPRRAPQPQEAKRTDHPPRDRPVQGLLRQRTHQPPGPWQSDPFPEHLDPRHRLLQLTGCPGEEPDSRGADVDRPFSLFGSRGLRVGLPQPRATGPSTSQRAKPGTASSRPCSTQSALFDLVDSARRHPQT